MSMSHIQAAQVVDITQISQDIKYTPTAGYYQQSIKANVPRIYNGSSNQFTPGDQYYGVITGRDDMSHFGRSIDVDFEGHRFVGGGPGYDSDRGYIAVYDWLYSGTPRVGSWNLIGNYINGPDPGGRFGECLSMDYDGQRIIVGAPRTTVNNVSNVGAVHIVDYNVNTGNFSITHTINGDSGNGVTSFGFSVSIAGDKADRFVVGAPNVNTIYVYEHSILTSTWTQTYSNVGTDSAIVNDVPLDCVGTRQTLYPEFNGYGYSVDMSGFGEHIAVGAPGTAVVQLRASGAMGTTTPGPVNHTVGEHAISSTGPHYTGGTGTGTGNLNFEGAPGGSTSNPITQSTSGRNTGGGWSCGSSRLAHTTGASGSHPFACRKLWNDGMTTLGTGVAEYDGITVPADSKPLLDGISSINDRDNWFFPNFQTGNVRILRCPDGGSWSSGVTQVGTVLKGFDNAIVPTVYQNTTTTRSAYHISEVSTGLLYWRTNRNGDSFPGFGQTVQISADGTRLTVSAPTETGHQYHDRAMQGNIYTYSFNPITGNYEDPLKDHNADGKGYEFIHDHTNSLYGMGTSLTEDGSRIFGSCFDHLQFLKVHDFSGKSYFMSSPIIVTHDTDADHYGGTLTSPIVRQTEGYYGDPVPRGYMSGWRTAAKNGKICAISMPAYPQCYGSRNSNDVATGTVPGSPWLLPNNGEGKGIVFFYRFPLTQVVSGNSLFEGTVKCMDLTIGSTTNSLSPAKLHFGGRLGEANTEQSSTIETRWLGKNDARYDHAYTTKYGIFDHELFISKFHGGDPVSTGWPQQTRGHWTRNQWLGSRIRLKAPKIEFQLQHAWNAHSPYEKYNEHTCVTITNNGSHNYINNSGFGDLTSNSSEHSYGSGHSGPSQGNNGNNELRQLMCIRTGTCNARVNAGLMLVAARNNSIAVTRRDEASGQTIVDEGRWVPDDGCHYTLAPGNDGWLYLLTERIILDAAGNHGHKQPESTHAYYDGTGGSSKTSTNSEICYAGLKVGNLSVMGSYTSSSDDRLKHFEEEIPDCLELINQLNPYKYKKSQKKYTENYTGDIGTENKDWNWEIGLIAQDIKKIPYLEFIVKDPETSSANVYSLRYNNFIGVCLQGVKDLHNRHQPELAKVATLQSDVATEKEKVTTLQSDLTIEKEKVETLQSDLTIEKEKVATLQSDVATEKEKVATLETDVEREKLKTTNLQERILVMEQAYHALLERVSDLENS